MPPERRRIRARASRRAGELLKEIEKAQGGVRRNQEGGVSPLVSRKQAAADAGLSPDQAKDVVRVANMPDPLMDLTPPRSAWIGLLPHRIGVRYFSMSQDPTAPKPRPSDDELLVMGIDPKTGIPWC